MSETAQVYRPPIAKFTVRWMEVGRLRRRELLRLFDMARVSGCSVTYGESKGFLDSLFVDIEVRGPDYAVRAVAQHVSSMMDDSSFAAAWSRRD